MKSFFFRTVLICFLILLAACGGGTVGTGGGRQYSGTVLDKSSQPIANATVSLAQSGVSTVTDTAGNFSLATDSPTEKETFTISIDDVETTATLEDIPEKRKVEVLFVVDQETQSVDVTVVEDDESEQTPTPEQPLNPENPDSETPDSEGADGDSDTLQLIASLELNNNAPLTVVPVADSFESLSNSSSGSTLLLLADPETNRSATAVLYFFHLDPDRWEYQLYVDKQELDQSSPRVPYHLASGRSTIDAEGNLSDSLSFEVQLSDTAQSSRYTLTVRARVKANEEVEVPPTQIQNIQTEVLLPATAIITTIPQARSHTALAAAAAVANFVRVVDSIGVTHAVWLYYFRTAVDTWQVLIVADSSELEAAVSEEVVVLQSFSLSFDVTASPIPSVTHSRALTIRWATPAIPQTLRITTTALIDPSDVALLY